MKLTEIKKLKKGDEVFWSDPGGDEWNEPGDNCSKVIKILTIRFQKPLRCESVIQLVGMNGDYLECLARELSRPVPVSSDPNTNWRNNQIQYPRLIAELQMVGAFSNEVISEVADSMDLDTSEVHTLIDRACNEWDAIKENTFNK